MSAPLTVLVVLGAWLLANAVKHLLARWQVFVDVDLLPPVYSTWRLLPGLPRWVVHETDDPLDQRIYPRLIRRVGIEWEPLCLRIVVHYASESRPGSGRLRTPRDTPQPRARRAHAVPASAGSPESSA